MIPVSLKFAAFGPYEKEQHIDFRLFRKDGLFLISGPTGAGKTAILDAMTYALFGRSSGGGRGSFASMRCQYAKEETQTFVEFTFEHKGKTYQFYRYLRPTRRKDLDGYEEMARAGELREDGALIPFAANMKKTAVDQYAASLLGLSYDQFRQIILLPQGQFERLLTADTEEKEKILRTLFGAELWTQAAEWLNQQANEMMAQARDLRSRRDAILQSAGAENMDALKQQSQSVAQEKQQIQEQLQQAQKVQEQAQAAEAQARRLEEQFARLDQLAEEQNQLEQQAEQIEQMRAQIAKAERAQRVLPRFEAYTAAQQQDEKRRNALEAAAEQLQLEERQFEQITAKCDREKEQQQILEALQQDAAKLAQQSAQAMEFLKEKQSFLQLREEWKKENAAKEKLEQETISLAQRQDELSREIAELEKVAEMEAHWNAETVRLEAEERNARLWQEVCQKLECAERRMKELAELAQKYADDEKDCDKAYEEAYERYLSNAALLVAKGLKPGDICPVCGNPFEKHTSSAHTEQVSRNQLMLYRERQKSAHAALEECKREQAIQEEQQRALKEQAKELEEQLGQGPQSEALHQAKARLLEAQNAAKGLRQGRQQRDALQEKSKTMQEKLREAAGLEQQKREELVSSKARMQALRESFEGEIRPEELQEEQRKKQNEIEALRKSMLEVHRKKEEAQQRLAVAKAKLDSAAYEQEQAKTELGTAKQCLQNEFTAQGFETEQALEEALMDMEQMDLHRQQIEEYSGKVQAAKREQRALLRMLEGIARPELDAITRNSQRAEAQTAELREKFAEQRERLRTLENILAEAKKADELLQKKAPEADMLQNFSATLRGNKGIGIGRFVMGILLSAVTREANLLLESVHGGRYRLLRTREAVGQKRKAGLNFEVFDALSGENRGVQSLSGGEKFLLSLALCLGLSVFLQRRTGKIDIQAMFIDEGFGTLDSVSIGEALDMLLSVKSSRRLVGIISHVSALSDTIPCAVQVKKGERGSSLRILT